MIRFWAAFFRNISANIFKRIFSAANEKYAAYFPHTYPALDFFAATSPDYLLVYGARNGLSNLAVTVCTVHKITAVETEKEKKAFFGAKNKAESGESRERLKNTFLRLGKATH